MAKDKVIALQATDAFLVSKSDTDTISIQTTGAHLYCALYVGTTGNINVVTAQGTTVLFSNVPVGFFPVVVKQVLSTNTTASNLVGLVTRYGLDSIG